LTDQYLEQALWLRRLKDGSVQNTSRLRRHYFVLIAVETLGALGEEAAAFISDLGRRIVATTGEPRSTLDSLPFSASQRRHPARQRRFCHRNFSPFGKTGGYLLFVNLFVASFNCFEIIVFDCFLIYIYRSYCV